MLYIIILGVFQNIGLYTHVLGWFLYGPINFGPSQAQICTQTVQNTSLNLVFQGCRPGLCATLGT